MFIGAQKMVEIKPPRLISESSGSKEVSVGDDFELVCECDKPVHWSYPQLTTDIEEVQSNLLSQKLIYVIKNGKLLLYYNINTF
jgi:hypothetical protein